MTEDVRAVVLAGGSGTRLWPLSRLQTPKQFLRLMGDETLLDATVNRLVPLVDSLLGDASKARNKLGWRPKTSFAKLVREMVDSDLAEAERDALAQRHGFKLFNRHE
jgi:nucleoside-diphosphate-sugar epimerase